MKFYPLKNGNITNIAEPVIKWIKKQKNYDQKASIYFQALNNLNELRKQIISNISFRNIQLIEDQVYQQQKITQYIEKILKYLRFMTIFVKCLGDCNGFTQINHQIQIQWTDSVDSQYLNSLHFETHSTQKFTRQFAYCKYNIGLLYTYKAVSLSQSQFIEDMNQSTECTEKAIYFFNTLIDQFFLQHDSDRFTDVSKKNVQMLKMYCRAIFYKNKFNMNKNDRCNIGLNTMGKMAKKAAKKFNQLYECSKSFFEQNPCIENKYKNYFLSNGKVFQIYFQFKYYQCHIQYYKKLIRTKYNVKQLIFYYQEGIKYGNRVFSIPMIGELMQLKPIMKLRIIKIFSQIKTDYKYISEHDSSIRDFSKLQQNPEQNHLLEQDNFQKQYIIEMQHSQILNLQKLNIHQNCFYLCSHKYLNKKNEFNESIKVHLQKVNNIILPIDNRHDELKLVKECVCSKGSNECLIY